MHAGSLGRRCFPNNYAFAGVRGKAAELLILSGRCRGSRRHRGSPSRNGRQAVLGCAKVDAVIPLTQAKHRFSRHSAR